jgi:hypothetical protein
MYEYIFIPALRVLCAQSASRAKVPHTCCVCDQLNLGNFSRDGRWDWRVTRLKNHLKW